MEQARNCIVCHTDFILDSDDLSYYEKIGVDIPRLCKECRAVRRLAFRNERVFYKRPCSKCSKEVITMFSANKPYPVWCYDCWWADDWDARDYAQDYDLSRPFFDQWNELWNRVPKPALVAMRSVDSEYLNYAADNKNCYLIIESSNNENCIHCYWIQVSNDLVDCSFTQQVERSYETDDSYNSYNLKYCKGCHSCTDSAFLLNCRGCSNCVGCINLRQKQYCIFNEQYTKAEYEQKLAELRLDTHSGVEAFRSAFEEFIKNKPRKYAEIYTAVNSTGNYMTNVKNNKECFHSYDAEDNAYCVHAWRGAKDCMDSNTVGRNVEQIYNSLNTGLDAAHVICGSVCWSSQFMQYCVNSPTSEHCFGSVGLRKKKYCILNKQYEKDEYEALRAQIIEQMKSQGIYGEFFPPELSAFGYNETSAMIEFPLSKEEAVEQGFSWEDTSRGTFGRETKQWVDVPDSIRDLDFDPVQEIYACTNCTKNYRIILDEANFYKHQEVPLPRLCPDCRHYRRLERRGQNKLWKRITEDGITVMTPYSPDSPEKIYSEEGYNNLVN